MFLLHGAADEQGLLAAAPGAHPRAPRAGGRGDSSSSITRPLAGGWLGLTGGAPDTVLILLDRSASMEQTEPRDRREQADGRPAQSQQGDHRCRRHRARGWCSSTARSISRCRSTRPALLTDLPQTEATETAADIPALLQSALDYITTNKTGRTDVWLLSDLQRSDWDAAGGRWATLRSAFATLQGVRFHLLCYPQPPADDLGGHGGRSHAPGDEREGRAAARSARHAAGRASAADRSAAAVRGEWRDARRRTSR